MRRCPERSYNERSHRTVHSRRGELSPKRQIAHRLSESDRSAAQNVGGEGRRASSRGCRSSQGPAQDAQLGQLRVVVHERPRQLGCSEATVRIESRTRLATLRENSDRRELSQLCSQDPIACAFCCNRGDGGPPKAPVGGPVARNLSSRYVNTFASKTSSSGAAAAAGAGLLPIPQPQSWGSDLGTFPSFLSVPL